MRRVALLLAFTSALFAQGRDYGRSMVISQQGIAATSQPLASQAAAQILAKGGSAVDAAIAANAVLAVVEPFKDGLGGDMFALYWEASTKKLTGINASGPAPKALTPEFLANQNIKTMPQQGIHSVTVPGAVDGWAKMHRRFGKLPWKDLFTAAIYYAENGFPVTEITHESWVRKLNTDKIALNPETARVYGKPPAEGELFKNPDMAKAFRLIATGGPEAFYKGPIAEAIIKTSQQLGGAMTMADLATFESEWVDPISTDYRGWRVYELPPNGQGISALEILNIMETTPSHAEGPLSAPEIHKRIEAMKLAFADLHRYVADPRTEKIPVAGLLSKDYARGRAKLIDLNKANCAAPAGMPPMNNTVYLTVTDKDGNTASWIQSIYLEFGSGVTVEGMGFPLQNRGAAFTLEAGHPNRLVGGKRPFHTIIPAFMERGDQHIGFGIMGGANQPMAHAQFVSNVVDYGMNIQAALEAPRFTKANLGGCDVLIESRLPVTTLQQLSERGHILSIQRAYTQEMGRGQAILHNTTTQTNFAASDPRADGSAIPEPMQ